MRKLVTALVMIGLVVVIGPDTTAANPARLSSSAVFDPCALLTTDELAGLGLGTDLHVLSREVISQSDELSCTFGVGDLIETASASPATPGSSARVALTVSPDWLDGFPSMRSLVPDRSVATRLIDRVICRDDMVIARLTSRSCGATDGPRMVNLIVFLREQMQVENERIEDLVRTAAGRLPERIKIPTLDLHGLCAEIDLNLARSARLRVGHGRTTDGPNGDIACAFDDFDVRVVSGPAARAAMDAARKFTTKSVVRANSLGADGFYTATEGFGVEAWMPVNDRIVNVQAMILTKPEWPMRPDWPNAGPLKPEALEFLQSLAVLAK